MDWLQLAQARKDELITELQQLIQINSVLNEDEATAEAPFGKGPKQALDWLLAQGDAQGMTTKVVDNIAGHIEMGEGEDLLGILCHVDVVPAGDLSNWQYPPFEGVVADGKLFGRGAIDDKGPTIAAWLAMKLVKDAGIPLTKRVRMIIGTDEETGFRCVDGYFKKEEMPAIGFAPDADFPLINAEKGIADLLLAQNHTIQADEQIVTFAAGHRLNMVPDTATVTLKNIDAEISEQFNAYLQENAYTGEVVKNAAGLTLQIKGKSAHAMEPMNGINAAVLLAQFLQHKLTTPASKSFVDAIVTIFGTSCYGEALHLDFADEASGKTTLNPGIVSFNEQGGEIKISMRYSVTYPFDEKITNAQVAAQKLGFTLDILDDSKPHYVAADDELVTTLEAIYRKYSGDYETPLVATGGGTYARVMKKAVAFGALFPGEADIAHQANEFVVLDNLVKAAAIYAEAIVKLASK